MDGIKGKVAIVTGSSSGLGRAIAIRLAQEGAKVIVSDIMDNPYVDGYETNKETTTTEVIKHAGGEAFFVRCDVSKLNDVKNLMKTTVDIFGHLDILCNNAGIGYGHERLDQKPYDHFEKVVNINMWGVIYCCKEAIEIMLKQRTGGKICNTSSVCSIRGCEGQSDYVTTKGAVAALSRQLCCDYGRYGININSVSPGWIKTSMQRFKNQEARQNNYDRDTPSKRCGNVEDVAAAVAFLVSSEADYVNGHEMLVDGGNTIVWESWASLESGYGDKAYLGYIFDEYGRPVK